MYDKVDLSVRDKIRLGLAIKLSVIVTAIAILG